VEVKEMLWWEVDVLFGKGKGEHLTGWTSEGTAQERWLLPITPQPIEQGKCKAKRDARLSRGDLAYIDDPMGLRRGNNLRKTPKVDDNLIKTIPFETIVRVLDGPICRQNMLWWEVRVKGSKLRGWMSEAEPRAGYNLVPLHVHRNRPEHILVEPGQTAFTGRYKLKSDAKMSVVPSGDGQVVTLLFSDMIVARPPETGLLSKEFSIELGVNSPSRKARVRQDVLGFVWCLSRGRARFRIKNGERTVKERWRQTDGEGILISTDPTPLPLKPNLEIKFALDVKTDSLDDEAYLAVDLVEIVLNPVPPPPPRSNG
jgi:hypothetical protein